VQLICTKGLRIAWLRFEARTALAVLVLLAGACAAPASDKRHQALWQALKSGEAFAIMRHAIAPGTGDPERFKVGDCSTQRNLSDRGRQQARKAGELLRLNGIQTAQIFSSQWCRCRETANLLAVGPVHDLASLNSFFESYERRAERTRQLRAWLKVRPPRETLLLVTHQVNISALTGRGTSSGEILIVETKQGGKYNVLGSIVP
jgi:phosphohistidine phosphatase SixA